SLRVDRLAIACNRSFAMLRLASESSEPGEAKVSLRQLDKAVSSENLFVVPCLAMMSREMWFSILNEIGVSDLERVFVMLPPGQCALCPANSNGQVDGLLSEMIDCAERWSGQSVQIIESADEVPQHHFLNVREYLKSDHEVDRRNMFTGFVEELRHSWDETMRVGNRAPDEAARIQRRKQTIQRTLLADDLQTEITGPSKPILAPLRQALIEAIGRNPANAGRVDLLVSETVADRCVGCLDCLRSCPVHARRQDGEIAVTDLLYCLGCSACIQTCQHDAIDFQAITGLEFLRD
ncbi:MAG: 4Fe-4S dicluster domain-containing protein, partial [Coriobacteriia bacterium]|nr:4Fe-4S dicluster domain-containing protein [Coriobacteriia bacterium]